MKELRFTVQDPCGLHARPAGILASLARDFEDTTIMVEKKGRSVNASALVMLMSLGIRYGDCLRITVSGPSEEEAVCKLNAFCDEYL